MDQRKSDPRVYIVTLLFLSCIVSGGVFLGLYLVNSDPNPLYLQVGMIFVGVPWLFWFMAYIYSCVLKPCVLSFTKKSVDNFDPEKGEENNNKTPENTTSASDPVASSTPRESEKHVQFGNVEVIGDKEGDKEEENVEDREGSSNNLIQNHMRNEEQDNQEHVRSNSSNVDEECDRTPLRLSVANK